jgi:glutaredoxin
MDSIVLFTNGCPRCKVIKAKLDQRNIKYSTSDDLDEILSKGFSTVPILKVNEDYLEFWNAVQWLNQKEGT